jgi:hypothetical protein
MRIFQKSLSSLTSSVHDRLWHSREMNSRQTVYCIYIHIVDMHVSIQFVCDLNGAAEFPTVGNFVEFLNLLAGRTLEVTISCAKSHSYDQ